MNVQLESSVRLLPDYETVRQHLPPRAWKYVLDLLQEHPVLVRVVPHRATKLGDYRPPRLGDFWHRITVNEDLNMYAFLVTLLHELAHVKCDEIGHTELFHEHFQTLLKIAEEKGLYDPFKTIPNNYAKHQNACGR